MATLLSVAADWDNDDSVPKRQRYLAQDISETLVFHDQLRSERHVPACIAAPMASHSHAVRRQKRRTPNENG
jgi:hypothetical protein